VTGVQTCALPIYIYDIEHDHWDGSAVLYDVLGVNEDHHRDLNGWLATVHPDDRDGMARYFAEEVVGKRAPFDREYRVVRHTDGAERWAHGLGSVEFADDGRPLKMFGVIQDVTESKAAEAELERRGARLEQLLEERERNLELLGKSLFSIIEVVTRVVEMRDPYTAGHERRVSELASAIAEELGMTAEEIEETRIAALIHDIGKMAVPAEILSKPGTLSPLEYELVKSHARAGFELLSSANLGGSTAEIIYQHHERCDGSGYPRGLATDDLLLASKILMVADVVEAMSSHRPYRPARGVDLALEEIERGAGTLYCPEAARACLAVFRERGFDFEPA